MSWFHNPAKLFGFTGLLVFLVRYLYPPPDLAGGGQLHSFVRFFDFRLDLTGYGLFEFVGIVFLLSALSYYLTFRLANRRPSSALVQLHFWPTLLFAILSIVVAHWVSRIPKPALDDPVSRASINSWLTGFTWTFLIFLVFQAAFATGALRSFWRSRDAETLPNIP